MKLNYFLKQWMSVTKKNSKQTKIVGYFDKIDQTLMVAYGWAADMSNFDKKIFVKVKDENNTILGSGFADYYRKDLEKAGIGDGRHAFVINLNKNLRKYNSVLLHIEKEDGVFDNRSSKAIELVFETKNTSLENFSSSLTQVKQKMYEAFDPDWFRKKYGIDIELDEDLFQFYLSTVKKAKLSPNQVFDEQIYLLKYPDVQEAINLGELTCGFEHYNLIGKIEGRSCDIASLVLEETSFDAILRYMQSLFDEDWYLKRYKNIKSEMNEKGYTTVYEHYLSEGIKKQYSPNEWFDEEWYISFYNDVYESLRKGEYLCGFEHYLLKGKQEKRISKRNSFFIVNYKFKEAVAPIGLEIEKYLSYRFFNTLSVVPIERDKERIFFIIPTIDRDIMFGGYISLIEFIKRFLKKNFDIKIIVTEDPKMGEKYFWYNFSRLIPQSDKYRKQVSFQNIADDDCFEISKKDRFFVYSAWTALIASKLVQYTDEEKFIFLRQEDERIFYDNNTQSAIIDYIYSLPQVAIFNTYELMKYFEKNKIGFYRQEKKRNFQVFYFEPVICSIEPINVKKLSKSKHKNFVFYARPEAHAKRNLFEVGIMALKYAIEQNVFDDNWNFYGIGAAKDYTVELAKGKVLKIKSKVSLEEYKKMLSEYNIGMFLMYAPHPGLLGLEMASAGLITVVNTYDYRDEAYFKNLSDNFVATAPDPYSLVKAMQIAIKKSSQIEERIKNVYKPRYKCWDEVLNDKFIEKILQAVNINSVQREK